MTIFFRSKAILKVDYYYYFTSFHLWEWVLYGQVLNTVIHESFMKSTTFSVKFFAFLHLYFRFFLLLQVTKNNWTWCTATELLHLLDQSPKVQNTLLKECQCIERASPEIFCTHPLRVEDTIFQRLLPYGISNLVFLIPCGNFGEPKTYCL